MYLDTWSIACIVNDLTITEECAADLYDLDDDRVDVDTNFRLVFSNDYHNHMDWLAEDDVRNVISKHHINGKVCFGSLQGDNFNTFWGYHFEQGTCYLLHGDIEWKIKGTYSGKI
jgi:hypothetical protein